MCGTALWSTEGESLSMTEREGTTVIPVLREAAVAQEAEQAVH